LLDCAGLDGGHISRLWVDPGFSELYIFCLPEQIRDEIHVLNLTHVFTSYLVWVGNHPKSLRKPCRVMISGNMQTTATLENKRGVITHYLVALNWVTFPSHAYSTMWWEGAIISLFLCFFHNCFWLIGFHFAPFPYSFSHCLAWVWRINHVVVARQVLRRTQFIYIEAWKVYKGGPLRVVV
jgi:hypothetical protein